MKSIGRWVLIAAAMGLALGLASSAQAKTMTWTGSLSGFLENFFFPYSTATYANGPIAGGGSAVVSGAAPMTVNLPRNGFRDTASYSVPSTAHQPGFPTSTSRHTIYNAKAKFFAGGGPGNTTFVAPPAVPGRLGTIKVTQGGSQFGGTMAILGVWKSKIVSAAYFGGYFSGTITNNLGTTTPTGGPAFGRTGLASGTFTHTAYTSITFTIKAVNSWGGFTTGAVQVKAPAPLTTTTTTVAGYDNRTPSGAGNLQLVTGWLAHYASGGTPVDDGAAWWTVNLTFAPRAPSLSGPGIALAAVLILGVAVFANRRR